MRARLTSLMQGQLGSALVKATSASVAVRVLAVLASIGSSIALARILGPNEFGLYAFVLSIATILTVPARLGVPALIVRETARAASSDDWGRMRHVWRWSLKIIGIGAVLVVALAGLVLLLKGDWLTPERRGAFIYGLPLIVLFALTRIPAAALRGMRMVFAGQFPDRVLRPALVAIGVTCLWFASTVELGAQAALLIHSGAAASALFVSALILRRRSRALHGEGMGETTEWWRSLWPLTLIAGIQIINENTDLVMLGALAADADVGYYKIAVSLGSLVTFGLTAVGLAVQPYLAELHAKQEHGRLQKLVSMSALCATTFTLPVVLAYALGGELILKVVFGPDYEASYWPLLILSLGQMGSAFFGVVGALLVMSGHERINVRALSIALIVNIALNALLIPKLAAGGAAIATAVSVLLWNFLYWGSARKVLGLDSSAISAAKYLRKSI